MRRFSHRRAGRLRVPAQPGKIDRVFTGIVRAQAIVRRAVSRDQGKEIDVAPLPEAWNLEIGGSVAIDGICLTVERLADDVVTFYVSQETLRCTTAAEWVAGRRVHGEPALRLGDALDGHMVQGHVDHVGQLVERRALGQDVVAGIRFPAQAAALFVEKGSVAVDGVSLTINGIVGDVFYVNLIPHTQRETHLADLPVGANVNLETDPMARQILAVVERLQQTGASI